MCKGFGIFIENPENPYFRVVCPECKAETISKEPTEKEKLKIKISASTWVHETSSVFSYNEFKDGRRK